MVQCMYDSAEGWTQMCWGMLESLKHRRYLDTLFNPKPLKWCIVFLCILVGFIFSFHRTFRLWNAVFIEAVTVVKMTGVWSHPAHAHPILLWEALLQWVTWESSVTLTRAKLSRAVEGFKLYCNFCLNVFYILCIIGIWSTGIIPTFWLRLAKEAKCGKLCFLAQIEREVCESDTHYSCILETPSSKPLGSGSCMLYCQ